MFLRGKYFAKAALDKLKADTAAGDAAQSAPADATVERIIAGSDHAD